MNTLTINAYKFSELSSAAKKTALENHRYDFCDDNLLDFCDFTTDKIKSIFEEAEFYYTGFYSQRDGACFTFSSLNFENLFAELEKHGNIFSNELKEFLKGNFACKGYLRGRDYHEHSISIEWLCEDCELFDDEIEKFADVLEDLRLFFCRKLYSELENTYNDLTSDEYVADCLEINKYDFLENGEDFKF